MIKSTELRLGNRMNGGIVCGINGGFIHIAGHFNISGMDSFQENELRPDPVTEEWLFETGFNEEEPGMYVSKDEPLFVIETYDKKKFKHVWDTSFTEAPSDYIYQIQNLYFALTGKELIEQ